jgi:hypothetical protein
MDKVYATNSSDQRIYRSFVYYQNFWTDSAASIATVMRRNQPYLSLSSSLFFPAASHTSQKNRQKSWFRYTSKNIIHQTPRVKYSNEDGLHIQSTLSYFFCGLGDDPDSHSEYAASFQHRYYRKQQQDPESPLIHIQSSHALHTILNRGCECRPRNF